MKNYLLVLLSVIGAYFLINGGISAPVSTSAAEIMPEASEEQVELLSEIDAVSEVSQEAIATSAVGVKVNYARATSVRTAGASTASSVSRSYSYTVTAHPGAIQQETNNQVNRVKKLVYAHNSSNLFLSVLSLREGDTFTLTDNGVTTTYRVLRSVRYEKTGDKELNHDPTLLTKIAYSTPKNSDYDIALMTCVEQSADAAHRQIVFAKEV